MPGGPPFGLFLQKTKFTSKKLVLNEYGSCLKMLEMAILETQFSKISFLRSMPPDTPTKLAPSPVVPPPPFHF